MTPRTRHLLAGLLITAGIAQLAFVAVVLLRSVALERATRGTGAAASPWSLRRAEATRARARPGHRIGHLEIPRLELRAGVVEGVDARSLLSGVGHVPDTAFPGEPDNAAFAGHRDMHFAPLAHIQVGDSIRIDTADGTFVYAVDSAFVVKPDRGDLMHATGRATLTLITCYPFHWIGPAPERFVIRAHGVAPRSAREVGRVAGRRGRAAHRERSIVSAHSG